MTVFEIFRKIRIKNKAPAKMVDKKNSARHILNVGLSVFIGKIVYLLTGKGVQMGRGE